MPEGLHGAAHLPDELVPVSQLPSGCQVAAVPQCYDAGRTWSICVPRRAEASALRRKAMPKIAEDLMSVPDHLASWPEWPADEGVRARLFGQC
jgi:hypothetical protein